MSQKVSIVLVRAFWCIHCQNFKIIYDKVKEIYKEFDFFNDLDIKFEDFDIANNDIHNTFMVNHYDIKDEIKGYPTIFINLKNETNKTNKYFPIDHTTINEKNNYEEAAKRFLINIINFLKSHNSDNKVLYIQKGGNTENKYEMKQNFNDELYKSKYLKYGFSSF